MNFRDRDLNKLLPQLLVVLSSLLIVLAAFAILYVVFGILGRFRQPILLFILGAVLAYLLAPLVNAAQRVLRARWASILGVYLSVVIVVLILGALLVTPIVDQSRSLAENLQTPSKNSLTVARHVRDRGAQVSKELTQQKSLLTPGASAAPMAGKILSDIRALRNAIEDLKNSTETAPVTSQSSRNVPKATAQTRFPPSLVDPLITAVNKLVADYDAAHINSGSPDVAALNRAANGANQVKSLAQNAYQVVSTTPVVLLSLQTWLDQHGFKVNIHDRFGSLSAQVNSKLASLLGNAVNILLLSGTLLVNFILVLIISIYFVSDGARLIRLGVQAMPQGYQAECSFFIGSLDHVMGAYIRGQIILAILAGTLGAIGAFVIGVPYAVLIGVSTAALSLIPVIGAVVLILPPVLVALLFTSVVKAAILLIYFMVFMQIVTNIIGPRVIGRSVGIHPLEAMAAALVGYPLAGFLGSFFAVPVVGFIHIAAAEAHGHFVADERARAMSLDPHPIPPTTAPTGVTEPEAPAPFP